MKRSRKYLEKREKVGKLTGPLDPSSALELLKGISQEWESVDLDVRLGVNPRKAEQNIRGTTVLPHGTGRTPRVLVLCKADVAETALEAGADHTGLEDMLEKITGGWLEFDMVIATPDVMKDVSKVAKILGPRGMMPNPKSGTVTPDVAAAIKECKAGKVEYRVDKTGIIHTSVGRVNFQVDSLRENIGHLVTVILRAKPSTVKGQYVKSIHLSTTQSPSIKVDPGAFSA
jgi:large subunit ribosomal protein L1